MKRWNWYLLFLTVANLVLVFSINSSKGADSRMRATLEILQVENYQTAKMNTTSVTLGAHAPTDKSDFQIAGSCKLIYQGLPRHQAGQITEIEMR